MRKTTNYISLNQKAYEKIKSMIMNLELKPGDRIPEEKIAHIINSSRTPVREALRKLSHEGLVTIYPDRFSEVTYYDEDDVKQIGVLRLSQDLLSCRLAIMNGSNADFEALEIIANKCEESARKGDVYGRIEYDSEFHLEIAKIGGNRFLIEEQEKLYQKIHLIQISKYTNIEDSIKQIKQHKNIIEALYDRDYDRIKVLVCEHLKSFYGIDQYIIDMYINK
ncbi:MAG TPA: GntR family transcriptional regulator [Tissierellaceae bacterium]